ncbi:MAG: carbon-nitrogen hydrolase family protein [Alphaproteobacteria bacterium]|jgi:predicted amidohydrolase
MCPAEARISAACIQVNAGDDFSANMFAACTFAREAKDAGAQWITFPENVAFMAPDGKGVRNAASIEANHEALKLFRGLAVELDVWLLVGSLAVVPDAAGDHGEDDDRIANRSFLLDNQGDTVVSYDKIHMFDATLDGGESYRESSTYLPGGRAVIGKTPFGNIGLSICYDLRFPYLYRALAHAGADIITVPSAFTLATGGAHWHTLLRARAIETGSFVIAPAQCGSHPRGRKTYGHSLIIDPWGKIIAEGGDAPGIVMAEIDLSLVARARAQIPSLDHDRDFTGPV